MPKVTKDINVKKVEKEVTKKTKLPISKKQDKKSETTAIKKKTTKNSNPKTTTKKAKSTNLSKTSLKPKNFLTDLEYYDLPYSYNQTTVKMLAQSPHTLFVYWDISDADKESFIKKYGDNFFNETKPVLIITNRTKNYTFEIEINDFANCWYFNIDDEKCDYYVELGRKPINKSISVPNNYIPISHSNEIESPNGHILFEKEQNTVYFRNVKNNNTYSEDIVNFQFIKRLQKIYKIYDLYKTIYKNEEFFDVNNPTSSFK